MPVYSMGTRGVLSNQSRNPLRPGYIYPGSFPHQPLGIQHVLEPLANLATVCWTANPDPRPPRRLSVLRTASFTKQRETTAETQWQFIPRYSARLEAWRRCQSAHECHDFL